MLLNAKFSSIVYWILDANETVLFLIDYISTLELCHFEFLLISVFVLSNKLIVTVIFDL